MRRDIERRLQALEQAFRKQGRIFTAILKDGSKVTVDAVTAISYVRDRTASEIKVDDSRIKCGELLVLLNDLLRENADDGNACDSDAGNGADAC